MKNKKLLWGVLIIVIAIAVLTLTVLEKAGAFVVDIPFYKLALSALVIVWLISNFTSSKLKDRFKIFMPLAVLYIIFSDEISAHFGLENDIIPWWIALIVAFLIEIGIDMIFGSIGVKKHSVSRFSVASGADDENGDDSYTTNMGSRDYWFDVSKKNFKVCNNFGQTVVHFQNTENMSYDEPVELNIESNFGSVVIMAPSDWIVINKVENSFGTTSVRPNIGQSGRTLIITGENNFGSVNVK